MANIPDSFWESVDASAIPLISGRESMSVLLAEYTKGSSVLREKIESLCAQDYTHFRKVRGDGNCLYRAFYVIVCSMLRENNALLSTFVDHILKPSESKLDGEKYKLVSESAHKLVARDRSASEEEGEWAFEEEERSSAFVDVVRQLVGNYLLENEALYSFYLPGVTVREYVDRDVLPNGVEAEGLAIVALANVFEPMMDGGCLKIYALDTTPTAKAEGERHRAIEHCYPEGPTKHAAALLHRPGHYDVLSSSNVKK
jgi:ubiquitin thioesterase protein OTUB1